MKIVKVEATPGQGLTRLITIAVEEVGADKDLVIESPSDSSPSLDTITIINGSGSSFVVRQIIKANEPEVQEEEITKTILEKLTGGNKLFVEESYLLEKDKLKINSNSTRAKFIAWGMNPENANKRSAFLIGKQNSLITADNKTELLQWAEANSKTGNHFAIGILKNKNI